MDNKTWMEFNHKSTVSGKMEKEIEGRSLNPVFVLTVVAIIIACLADAVTVYILSRFKKLQKQHQNVYIFHISVLNLINFPFTIFALVSINYADEHNNLPSKQWWGFLLVDIIASLIFAQFSLITIMTIDWYMFTFAPQKSAIFRGRVSEFTKAITISAYLYVFIVTLYTIVVFFWHGYPGFLSAFLVLANLLLSFILYLVFGAIYFCRRKSLSPTTNAVALKISLIRVLIWLFLIISFLIAIKMYKNKVGIMHNIAAFFMLLVILSPLLQLILLYFWDRNYKAALSRIFCCRQDNQTESGEDLEKSTNEGAAVYTQHETN